MTGSCVDPGDRKCPTDQTPEPSKMVQGSSCSGSSKDIVPPDGGWGWVVVFASFMIHVVADGVTYTFGIFYYEFLKYFGESKGKTAWIASIMTGATYCIGPLASGLTNKYGCRAVTVGGAVLAASGLIMSIFAPNVPCLFFTIGICSGAGFGLMYLPSIVSVTCYFEKKRAFATGMAVCGSGMGTFALAPLTECLVEHYGWKGAMLIIAGLVLNCAVFGALFRPLEATPQQEQTVSSASLVKKKKSSCPEDSSLAPLVQTSKADTLKETRRNGFVVKKDPNQRASIQTMDNFVVAKDNSTVVFTFTADKDPEFMIGASNGCLANGKKANGCLLPKSNTDEISPLRSTLTIPSDFLRRKVEGTSLSSFVCSSASLAQTNKELLQLETYSQPLNGGILYRQDIFYSGSIQNLSKYRSHPNISYTTVNNNSSARPAGSKKMICGCCPQEVTEAFMEVTNFSLLKDPIFLMFGISNFLTSIGFNVPYVYTKDRVADLGIASNEDASFLLAIIGISNTVGRITLGYLSDRSCVNRLWVYNTSLVVSGLATALSCYAANYTLMAMYCATFGVTTGAYVSLTSVILVDLLGLDKLTNAFGLLLVFQGVSCLLGPPITGWLYDGLGSYDPGFYMSGAMIAASGFMLFFVPCVQKLADVKKQQKQNSSGFKSPAVDTNSIV